MATPSPTRVALVHDWLTGMRGGEKVLEVLCQLYPHAELFTLLHVPGSVSPAIEQLAIRTSALQSLPGVRRYYRQCLLLFPTLIEQFDLDGFDLVISSSHCVAKSVIAAPDAVHICYCHTPMRYAWDQFDAYFGPERLGRFRSALMRPLMGYLARWDRETARRVTRFITNSRYVAGRITQYYDRESTVVHPPVDTEFFRPGAASSEPYALVVSALAPYKRIEVAIEACALAGIPLRIVGDGPERRRLERIAASVGGDTSFLGRIADTAIRDLYGGADMVLLPGEEDFGIVPVEAQACGRPVVALAAGGALETVVDGEAGILVREATPQAFAEGIRRARHHVWDTSAIRQHAEHFSRARFAAQIHAIVDETWRLGGKTHLSESRARNSLSATTTSAGIS